MASSRVLAGRLVILRPLRRQDAPALDRILRDGQATRFLPARVRQEDGRRFVTRVLRDQHEGHGLAFAVFQSGTEEAIGQARLFNWSHPEHSAELGVWLRRSSWGQGFGTEAIRLLCRYGFRSMSLHRIEALVVDGNAGSRRALESAGFQLEGTERRSARVGARWADTWRFGLLRGELVAGDPS